MIIGWVIRAKGEWVVNERLIVRVFDGYWRIQDEVRSHIYAYTTMARADRLGNQVNSICTEDEWCCGKAQKIFFKKTRVALPFKSPPIRSP